MKNLYLLLLLCLWMGCKPSVHRDTQADPDSMKTDTSVIPFSGSWIHETYYNSIRDTRSPRAAQELISECFIRIPDRMDEKTVMVYGFHETGPELQMVVKDSVYTLWELQGDTLNKAAFVIKPMDDSRLKIGEHTFVRINPDRVDDQYLILEELLFKGTYTRKNGGSVVFSNTGEVSGLGNYKYYHVLTDYMDAGLQIDQVGLAETPDKFEYFGFKSKGDVLEVYELRCISFDKAENRCVEVAYGKLIHSLSKQE